MKKLALLDYSFMFDPDSTFDNVYDFENKLADFFKKEGYEAQTMDMVRGQQGRGVFFISKIKKDMLDDPSKSYSKVPPQLVNKGAKINL